MAANHEVVALAEAGRRGGIAMAEHSVRENVAVIIMAGGMGTRFWPASRESFPKQFLPICGPNTMVEECFQRIAPLTDPARIFVIINAQHETLTREILGDTGVRILEEPYGRNTAPCIGLGCIHVMEEFGDIPIIALPADHYVCGEEGFRRCLKEGISRLKDEGIVTIGITPTHPETGYGYIEKGPGLGRGKTYSVIRFVEKPDFERAMTFIASRQYLWNAGIFAFKPSTMLREIGLQLPGIAEGLNRISDAIGTDNYPATLEEAYREMDSVSIDYGVMEKTREPVSVVQGDFGWSDVGNWAAVRKLREAEEDEAGNIMPRKAVLLNTQKTFIHSQSDRLIAVLGLQNLLVVDTEDILLVADIDRSQEVRRLPEILREKGWGEYV